MGTPTKRTDKLHPLSAAVVEHYMNLKIGSGSVVSPYFMNDKNRKGRRVAVGKGSPALLERAVRRLARKHKFDLANASAEEIREFMIHNRLGVDCSGFVVWSLNDLAKLRTGRPLWTSLRLQGSPLRTFLVKRIRPVENISVKVLTNEVNSITIKDLQRVRPGDIIRSLNGNHVLLISEVGFSNKGVSQYFKYVNSTEYQGIKHGILEGIIIIKDVGGCILDQDWTGTDWIFKGAKDYPDDTRIVRLKVLNYP